MIRHTRGREFLAFAERQVIRSAQPQVAGAVRAHDRPIEIGVGGESDRRTAVARIVAAESDPLRPGKGYAEQKPAENRWFN